MSANGTRNLGDPLSSKEETEDAPNRRDSLSNTRGEVSISE